MSAQLSNLSGRVHLGDSFQTSVLHASLKKFVNQFGLMGCSLFWLGDKQQQPDLVGYCCDQASGDFLLYLPDFLAVWQQIAAAQLFEVVCLEHTPLAVPYQLYSCAYRRTPEALCYLLCWHSVPLSEHQRYGLSLYAQTLTEPRSPSSSEGDRQVLNDILQRSRHQLRTPLSLISLYVDLLKSTSVDRRSQEWLGNLQTTVEEMSVSLDHLTELNTFTDNSLGNYDLRQLLEQCCQEMQPWIEQKQLTISYDSYPLWLRVNGWKIKQVLQNILSNAIAFSPIAGQIICGWQTFQTEVLIKISDNGPGLSAADLRSIGTPFYSRRPGGTGLGLSIARQIMLEHEGGLWAENLPEGGAQFCLTLPRSS